MQQLAITYGILLWVSFWEIDLLVTVARGPVLIDPIAKLIVATIVLVILLVSLWRNNWLLP